METSENNVSYLLHAVSMYTIKEKLQTGGVNAKIFSSRPSPQSQHYKCKSCLHCRYFIEVDPDLQDE